MSSSSILRALWILPSGLDAGVTTLAKSSVSLLQYLTLITAAAAAITEPGLSLPLPLIRRHVHETRGTPLNLLISFIPQVPMHRFCNTRVRDECGTQYGLGYLHIAARLENVASALMVLDI